MLNIESFRGLRPLDPCLAGALPLRPDRGSKAGPWIPPMQSFVLTHSQCALCTHSAFQCPPPHGLTPITPMYGTIIFPYHTA